AEVVIRYRWQELLWGRRDPAGAVDRVEVEAPRVRLSRSRRGQWNFEELVRHAGRGRPAKFHGRVLVRDARVAVCGAFPPQPGAGAWTELRGLSLQVDARDYARVTSRAGERSRGLTAARSPCRASRGRSARPGRRASRRGASMPPTGRAISTSHARSPSP